MVVNARVKDSLQNYHTLFSGVKLHHLTLLAVSGHTKSCICPGRLNSLASPWFSCLNRVYTCRFHILECQIHWAQFCLQQCWYSSPLPEELFCQSLQCKNRHRAVCRRRDPLLPEGGKTSQWFSQFKSGWNTINPLGGYFFSKPKLIWVKTWESQGGEQDCPLTALCENVVLLGGYRW